MTMGINSNYEAFVNWAGARPADTIASASRADGQMVVSNKVGDGIGFLAWRRRDADQVSANNATRELFFAAVRDMFGGEAFIPQSVKDAMHFDTFKAEKGRPLSARRINAVKVAVDQWKAANTNQGASFMSALASNKAAIATNYSKQARLDKAYAQSMVSDAMGRLGVKLDKAAAKAVANLVVRHGTGMPAWKLSILANYIVSRKADPNTPVAEAQVAKLAADMKRWRSFGLEDNMVLRQLGGKVAEIANAHVREKFNDGSWFMTDASQQGKNKRPVLPNVAEQFYVDITSGSWNFGNGTIELDPKMSKEQTQAFTKNVLDQFNKTIDDKIPSAERRGAAKKVLSTLLHQGNFSELEFLTRKQGQLAGIPGADFFVSKSTGDDDWESIVTGSTKAWGLEISEDGTTATVTVSIGKTITSNGSSMDNHKIGTVLLCQKMTVDLTQDIPEVTDVKFSQKISTDKTDLTDRSVIENLQIASDGPEGIED